MLPILLPARAYGSILYGLRLSFSGFGISCRGEGSAGRAVHASHVPRKTYPASLRRWRPSLVCRPKSLALSLTACALQDSTMPEPLPPAICYAIDTAAIDGNHRQQSTTRRHYLCGTAAKWRTKAVAVVIGRFCCRYCCLLGLMVRYSTGYGFRFRASGFRAAARVRQAGRFTRHTFRVKPTLPACAGGDPRLFAARNPLPYHLPPAPYKIRPCPSHCRLLYATQSTRRQ